MDSPDNVTIARKAANKVILILKYHTKVATIVVAMLCTMLTELSLIWKPLDILGLINDTSNSGGGKWKHIYDHQGWVQQPPRTKGNYRTMLIIISYP